jgi:hypothetical protein
MLCMTRLEDILQKAAQWGICAHVVCPDVHFLTYNTIEHIIITTC